MILNALLFDDFETLDLFGPIEIFGKVEDMELRYLSFKGALLKMLKIARLSRKI